MQPDNPLTDAPDGILAARAADGDVCAFEVIVVRHGPMMRAYAEFVKVNEASVSLGG
jgi:RNA polymerase sigma-70 factor (ECF subfamily)